MQIFRPELCYRLILIHFDSNTGVSMMEDRREGKSASAISLERLLNVEQRMTLHQMESFGWTLKFVRQPLFQEPVPVMYDADTQQYAILQEDGQLNKDHGLLIRSEDVCEAP